MEHGLRCLVIENEIDTSHDICKGLTESGYTVTACNNGMDGLDLAMSETWDIMVLDRMLPGRIDGLSINEKLRSLGNSTQAIIVSALGSIDERVLGLRGGADDYLPKPFAFSELLARIEALLQRASSAQDSFQLQVADLELDTRAMRVTRAARLIALQPRECRLLECQLLECLMRHAGQVVTCTMLPEAGWDYHFDPQTNLIDVQISRLRTKIDKDFSPQLIHAVRGAGYRLASIEDGSH